MKKQKKVVLLVVILFFSIILGNTKIVFADNGQNYQNVEYTEKYKKWLKLPEEEREKVIQPLAYDVKVSNKKTNNILLKTRVFGLNNEYRYSLKDIIPQNLLIKNQQTTNSCWAFASLSSLETNLALRDFYGTVQNPPVYDFSERHLVYATSQSFLDGATNPKGYSKNASDSGNWYMFEGYLKNGMGPIPENEMPFENNEDDIYISEIQNKTVSTEVYDTIRFPNYNLYNSTSRNNIMNNIKQHIKDYGAVFSAIHGAIVSQELSGTCYKNSTGAKYCNDEDTHYADHAISIIGWDDNYSIENFESTCRPTNPGAWIIRNSWGEEYGDNGIMYVSYEDCNIGHFLSGIIKANDEIDYENIYGYDDFFAAEEFPASSSDIYLCNVFDKKTLGNEYITQVSLSVPQTCTCKVYVNPNGEEKSREKLQPIELKAGEGETFEAGYHTLEFKTPLKINGDKFAVAIEIQTAYEHGVYVLLENKSEGVSFFDNVKVEEGKCFFTYNLDGNEDWVDLSKITEINENYPSGDSTIRVFSVSQAYDESLTGIEIVEQPTKKDYYEGENFDSTGMVVKAYYNSQTTPEVILGEADYEIENASNLTAGQEYVTIKYGDYTEKCYINVEANTIQGIEITKEPDTKEYIETQNFDKTGMEISAVYANGNRVPISDYTLENDENLQVGQKITIKYGEFSIEYDGIEVRENELQDIEVTKAPNKTNYTEGEDFESEGMEVVAIYEVGEPKTITDYTLEDDKNLQVGQQGITIKYGEKSKEYPITIKQKVVEPEIVTLTEITIKQEPNKKEYTEGDDFDKSGMIVEAVYSNGNRKEITDYTLENDKNLQYGEQGIIIKYEGISKVYYVTVAKKEVEPEVVVLNEIRIVKEPNKKEYIEGEDFDSTGMEVEAIYSNGTHEKLDRYTLEHNTNLVLNQKTVTIWYKGKNVTQEISVRKNEIIEIKVIKAPNKTEYTEGEDFEKTGMKVVAVYEIGEQKEITNYTLEHNTNLKANQNYITIKYENFTVNYNITVKEKQEEPKQEEPKQDEPKQDEPKQEEPKTENPENFDVENAKLKIDNIKYYTYTKENKKDYYKINVTINGLSRSNKNDKLEYYYYLSSTNNEKNIKDWVKIEEAQAERDKIQFTINTNDISNYQDIMENDNIYLYVKEVAVKGGNQSIKITDALKLSSTTVAEIYVDDKKVEETKIEEPEEENGEDKKAQESQKDNTTAPKQLPNTGSTSIIIFAIVVAIIGGVMYFRYKRLKNI